MIAIQITFTALIPFLIGLIVSIPKSIKKQLDWMKIGVIALWFFVPLALVVMGASVVRRLLEGGAEDVGEFVAGVRTALDHWND